MWSSTFNYLSLSLVLIFCVSSVFPTEYVPVYVWGRPTTRGLVPALSRVSKDSFKDVVLDRIEKKSLVVVFAERNLSPEDFSLKDASGNTVLPKLSQTKSQNSYWPSVQNPLHILHHLPKVKVNEMSIKENGLLNDEDISKLLNNLQIAEDQILIINLNDARDDEDRTDMLKRHDEFIHKIFKKLASEREEILAIYTSRHSSWIIPQENHKLHRQSRQLLAVQNEAPANSSAEVFNTTNILMYVSGTPVIQNNTDEEVITSYDFKTSLSGNNLTVTFLKDEQNSIEMLIVLTESNYWILEEMNVMLKGNAEKVKVKNVYAPDGFSYHCTKQLFFGESSKMNVSFPGLQIQPYFGNQSGLSSFGDAYDCVGFTSAPIWSGLFVTFILVLILTLGISMMMDIKTMDRFDDPKGKTITIIASE